MPLLLFFQTLTLKDRQIKKNLTCHSATANAGYDIMKSFLIYWFTDKYTEVAKIILIWKRWTFSSVQKHDLIS